MTEHRVLVCGGRNYLHRRTLYDALDELRPTPTLIIQGGANGADRLAKQWAQARGIECEEYAVDHVLDGPWPAAGPRRNKRMLLASKPHSVVAAPGGKGTANMVRLARSAGVSVIEIP